jgi:type IX secretion system substrate protein
MNIIKLFVFLIVFATNILAIPVEVLFHYERQWKTEYFTVKVTPVGDFWIWNDSLNYPVLGDSADFSLTYGDTSSIGFDCPKGDESDAPVMPWGVIDFQVQWKDPQNSNKVVNFTIDFRDEDWATNGSKYVEGANDLYIRIDTSGYFLEYFISSIANKRINEGDNYTIWSMFKETDSTQTNFCVPVTMKNRLEGYPTYDFGQLLGNGIPCNSGSLGNLRALIPGPVAHSTTFYEDAGIPRQNSFVWEYYHIIPEDGEFPYSPVNFVTVPNNDDDKEVTRNFRKVYPLTIKNVLTENGGISVDNIDFKDPLLDNQFYEFSAAPNGYVKNDAFRGLEIDLGLPELQKYSVRANESFAYNGRNYYWYGGDFSPTYYGTDVVINGDTTVNANFKGTQLSSSTGAFASGSQRKFVKTNPTTTYTNGVLHMVYESLGSVWYEYSTDNGQTWIVADGEPVATNAQNPSIAVQNNSTETDSKVIVVYETGSYLKYWLYRDGNKGSSGTLEEGSVSNPVVAWSADDRIVVSYELDLSGSGSGIYHNVADMPTLYTIDWEYDFQENGVTGQKVTNTSENSTNPTITHQGSTNYFHLAWQENTSAIKYIKMTWNEDRENITYSNYAEPSSGVTGYSHFDPSISMYGEYPVVAWIRQNVGTYIKDCALRINFAPSPWSQLYTYGYGGGDDVDIVNINEGGSYNFILTWGGYGNYDKYLKSNSTTTTYSLSTTGDVQVSNGSGFSGMRIQSFDKYNSPYDFTISGTDGLLKTNGVNDVLVARQFDLLNDDLNIQAGISEVTVDGQRIAFVGEDSFNEDPTLDFESKLETEPFLLTNNSEFTFSFNHDASVLTPAALSTTNNVKIKVMLVDAQTDETIGVLHENIIDGTQQILSGVNNFLVNTSGIGEREVKLKIKIKDKLKTKSDYTITTRVISEGGELEKENYEEISYTGESPVTEYTLAQNYPNPFNPTTSISYQIPNDGNVSLKIYDLLGAEVMTLVNKTQTQGRYEVNFDASALSSGVYIYRIQANKFVESRKMMLLK